MNFLLKNVRLLEPYLNIDDKCNILIKDGIIEKISNDDIECDSSYKVITGKNLLVTNGFIDMHVHFRDPGFTHKEDIISGSKSAACGGFTCVCTMPNTNPVVDNVETLKYINEKSKSAFCQVLPFASVTKGERGVTLNDFKSLKNAGAIGFTDDGLPVENDFVMENALLKSIEDDFLIVSHCEDFDIIDGGIINNGEVSKILNVKGMDRTSEDSITLREINLAKKLGARIHIAHVSTKGSVDIIRKAKAEGVKVTCETCPHYFTLTDKELLKKDANFRMNPPLRESDDVEAIINGLVDGTIDAIITDHAPHTKEEKKDFLNAPNGIIGLETCFSLCYEILVLNNHLSLNDLFLKMIVNPRRILSVTQKPIEVGNICDLVVIDLDKKWVVNEDEIISKSKNTPFLGREMTSKVILTLFNKKETYRMV